MAEQPKAFIEVVSDGTRATTHVVLVLVAPDGATLRYNLPGVLRASWNATSEVGAVPTLSLDIKGAKINARVDVGSGTIEDILTELTAGKLATDTGDEPARYDITADFDGSSAGRVAAEAWNARVLALNGVGTVVEESKT